MPDSSTTRSLGFIQLGDAVIRVDSIVALKVYTTYDFDENSAVKGTPHPGQTNICTLDGGEITVPLSVADVIEALFAWTHGIRPKPQTLDELDPLEIEPEEDDL